jgi:hypothetical protein
MGMPDESAIVDFPSVIEIGRDSRAELNRENLDCGRRRLDDVMEEFMMEHLKEHKMQEHAL